VCRIVASQPGSLSGRDPFSRVKVVGHSRSKRYPLPNVPRKPGGPRPSPPAKAVESTEHVEERLFEAPQLPW
jgi:hypothetical protein